MGLQKDSRRCNSLCKERRNFTSRTSKAMATSSANEKLATSVWFIGMVSGMGRKRVVKRLEQSGWECYGVGIS